MSADVIELGKAIDIGNDPSAAVHRIGRALLSRNLSSKALNALRDVLTHPSILGDIGKHLEGYIASLDRAESLDGNDVAVIQAREIAGIGALRVICGIESPGKPNGAPSGILPGHIKKLKGRFAEGDKTTRRLEDHPEFIICVPELLEGVKDAVFSVLQLPTTPQAIQRVSSLGTSPNVELGVLSLSRDFIDPSWGRRPAIFKRSDHPQEIRFPNTGGVVVARDPAHSQARHIIKGREEPMRHGVILYDLMQDKTLDA